MDVYRAGQYALGYRIPNVGLLRFQFIGSNRDVWRLGSIAAAGALKDDVRQLVAGVNRGDRAKNADVLEFAFLYDGYQGLRVDAGFKLPLEYETDIAFRVFDSIFYESNRPGVTSTGKGDDYTVKLPNVAALGASWTPSFLPALNIMTRFDLSFGGRIESKDSLYSIENGLIFGAWLTPSYKIIPNLTLGLDFGMDIHRGDKIIRFGMEYPEDWLAVTEYNDFGLAPWVELAVGGGKVRTGIVIMLPGSPRYKPDNTSAATVNSVTPKLLGDPVVSMPISVTYSF
jgi:hypothetical protein